MKINKLDAHDRFSHLTKQDFDIGACCQDLINQRPFGEHAFYLFAHPRTDDDGLRKRLIWQPRLTKPKAQSNSMLFKGKPGTEDVRVIWMIPAEEMWGQYKKGYLTENKIVAESIEMFQNNRGFLEQKEPDDLDDERIDAIYKDLAYAARAKKATARQVSSAAFPSSGSLFLPLPPDMYRG